MYYIIRINKENKNSKRKKSEKNRNQNRMEWVFYSQYYTTKLNIKLLSNQQSNFAFRQCSFDLSQKKRLLIIKIPTLSLEIYCYCLCLYCFNRENLFFVWKVLVLAHYFIAWIEKVKAKVKVLKTKIKLLNLNLLKYLKLLLIIIRKNLLWLRLKTSKLKSPHLKYYIKRNLKFSWILNKI